MTRPNMHSHLTEYAAVARATAGKVLASRCAGWSGLGSQVPDLVLGPLSAAADSGELQQASRRDTTCSFGMSSKVCVGWAASAITPGRQSLNGRAQRNGVVHA